MPNDFPDTTMAAIDADHDLDPLGPPELPDELLAGAGTPEEIAGPDGLLNRLTKRLLERAMAAERSRSRSHSPHRAPGPRRAL